MGSENKYQAGHVIIIILIIQAVTIKTLIIIRSFICAFAQSYLGRLCLRLSNMRHFFFAYFAVDHVAAFKNLSFRAGFQSEHYHFLWTCPYQEIVPLVLLPINRDLHVIRL